MIEMPSKDEIAEAIWSIDPAGISTIRRDAPLEYDELASGVYKQLELGYATTTIVAWVDHYLATTWGITTKRDTREAIETWIGSIAPTYFRRESGDPPPMDG